MSSFVCRRASFIPGQNLVDLPMNGFSLATLAPSFSFRISLLEYPDFYIDHFEDSVRPGGAGGQGLVVEHRARLKNNCQS